MTQQQGSNGRRYFISVTTILVFLLGGCAQQAMHEPRLDELPLVSPLERAVFLRAQPYFDGLDPAVIAVLASHTREHRARAGDPAGRPS